MILTLRSTIVIIKNKKMKAQSPGHRMIQLRRKTEKIVIPKMTWDLSNKQNHNLTNLYETSKSKNNSSKKNSMERKYDMKKTLSMTQNILKCTLKKVNKNDILNKDKKQFSLEKGQKRVHGEKKQAKSHITASIENKFTEDMNKLLKKAKKKQPTQSLKQSYKKYFSNLPLKNESQKNIVMAMSQHIEFWLQKCQSLENTLSMMCQKTPKLECQVVNSEEGWNCSEEGGGSSGIDSQVSMCSYIVDPKEEIKMKPIKKELKQQLQLNFQKVDYFRKKQF